jgi:hypothetical protein
VLIFFFYLLSFYQTEELEEEIERGIFGLPLKLALKYSAQVNPGLSLPIPIYRCFEEIFKRGKTLLFFFKNNNNNENEK